MHNKRPDRRTSGSLRADAFVTVTKAECIQCLDIMYGAIEFVQAVRRQLGLGCEKVDKKLPGNRGGNFKYYQLIVQ